MESKVLYSILLSFIGTGMIKITYDVNDFIVLMGINVVILGVALYVYFLQNKKQVEQETRQAASQKNITALIGDLGNKIESFETQWLEGNKTQTEDILNGLEKSEEKVGSEADEQMAAYMDKINQLIGINQKTFELLENKLAKDEEQMDSLIKGVKEITEIMNSVVNELSTKSKEMIGAIEEAHKEIKHVTARIVAAEETLGDNITNMSDDIQGGLNKLNKNIQSLGDKNCEISKDYQKLWNELSKELGETAIRNQQVLVLLHDHYKVLKEVASGI